MMDALEEKAAWRMRILGRTLVVLAIGLMVGRGIDGVGATNYLFQDFDYFYAAGKCWLAGQSPYDFAVWPDFLHDSGLTGQSDPFFAYPPTFAPLAMAYAWMSPEMARITMALVNCVALWMLVWLTIRMVTHPFRRYPASDMPLTPYLLAAFVIGCFGTTIAFWLCQTSFIVAAALVGGWYLYQHGHVVLAGVVLAVAAVKPQYAALPMFWLLLERQWKLLAAFTVTSLALAAYPMWLGGPIEPFMGFLHNLGAYDSEPANQLGDRHLLGLPSLIVAAGGPVIEPIFALAITAMLLVLVRGRQRWMGIGKDDQLAVIMCLTLTLVAVHPWDLVLAAPIAGMFWLHAGHRPLWAFIGFLLASFYNMPLRVAKMFHSDVMLHWPTMALIGATLCLLILMRLDRTDDPTPTDASAPAVKPARPVTRMVPTRDLVPSGK